MRLTLPPKNRTEHRVRESVQVREKGERNEQAGSSTQLRRSSPSCGRQRSTSPRGDTVGQAVRKLGVSEQTYYRWRREYGGMRVDQAKRLKELERENARLKQLVAEQALDNSIVREVASGNF